MAQYVYPAIFTQEDGGYSVSFPDIHNCFTSGETLPEAMEMAEDVLCMMLYEKEEAGEPIPAASDIRRTVAEDGSFVSLISCDTIEYRKFHDNRAVKKTLSIPSWLNDMAERAGVNFSGTLQEALKHQLNI
jgi:predicted RNase H-like HicB family nuclease